MNAIPARIFLVRHGERLDHEDPGWAMKAERPHDPPLTKAGHDAARSLGLYLRTGRFVQPENVSILASPLLRCVETAQSITRGLVHAHTNPSLQIPILLEPGLVESVYYIHKDICKNKSLRGEHYPPWPIYQLNVWHKQHVTERVMLESAGMHPAPQYLIDHHGNLNELPPVDKRCAAAAKALIFSSAFAGRDVILVGHGQTTVLWYNAIATTPIAFAPPFTGVAELMPAPQRDNGNVYVLWHPQCTPFSTPHLGTEGPVAPRPKRRVVVPVQYVPKDDAEDS